MIKMIAFYCTVGGVSVAVGAALGLYMAGYAHWIPWAVLVTFIVFGSIGPLLIRSMRRKPNWDPSSLATGFRLVFTNMSLFASGTAMGYLAGGWNYLIRTHESLPNAWVTQVAMAVMFVSGGAWWLSWPQSDPERGPSRWVGWFEIAAGVVTALFAIFTVTRE